MKKKILITGGSGFIGNALIKELINLGYKINCLDIKKAINQAISQERNRQLNQFSLIYYNKIKQNIFISEK